MKLRESLKKEKLKKKMNNDNNKLEKIELIKSYLNDLDLNLKKIVNESIEEMKSVANKTDKENINKLLEDIKNM